MLLQKPENRLVLCVFTALFLLCTGLRIGIAAQPEAVAVVENRKAVLYDAAHVPPVPAGTGVNINTADAAALDTLPGIGETLAVRIVAHREKYGEFLHPAAIMEVSGIGEEKYAALKDKICVK